MEHSIRCLPAILWDGFFCWKGLPTGGGSKVVSGKIWECGFGFVWSGFPLNLKEHD